MLSVTNHEGNDQVNNNIVAAKFHSVSARTFSHQESSPNCSEGEDGIHRPSTLSRPCSSQERTLLRSKPRLKEMIKNSQ